MHIPFGLIEAAPCSIITFRITSKCFFLESSDAAIRLCTYMSHPLPSTPPLASPIRNLVIHSGPSATKPLRSQPTDPHTVVPDLWLFRVPAPVFPAASCLVPHSSLLHRDTWSCTFKLYFLHIFSKQAQWKQKNMQGWSLSHTISYSHRYIFVIFVILKHVLSKHIPTRDFHT